MLRTREALARDPVRAELPRSPFTHARSVAAREGLLAAFLAWFAWFGERAWARRAILAINLGGIAYGFWFYLPQFRVTPWYYWPLVPDSPLAVLWATAALLVWEFGRRSPALEGLAFVGNVEVGLWTAFVLLFYDRVHWPRLDFILFWLHLAMAGLALVFVKPLRDGSRRAWAVGLGVPALWYGLNVAFDYWYTGYAFQGCVGLHPISIHKPGNPCGGLEVVGWVTVGLTVLSLASLALLTLRRSRSRA